MGVGVGIQRSMRLLAVAFVLLSALSSEARIKLQGYAEQGGQQHRNAGIFGITRAGSTQTNPYTQQSYPSATVTVYVTGTLTPATLYADAAGTTKANPFTASSNAYWSFYIDDGTYDIRFSGGGITVPYTWSSIVVDSDSGVLVSITGMGAICDGSTDDTAAIQAALDLSTSSLPKTIQLPAAACKFTSQLLIDTNRTRIVGVGSYASTLLFVPASGGISAFKAQNATAGTVIRNIEFSGFRLYSSDTTLQKIGFDIVDGSFVLFDGITLGSEDQWKGNGNSIGIKLRGREFITIRDSSIWANDGNALSIEPNPNNSIDADYLRIENSVFSGDKTTDSVQPVINILSNVQITRSIISGINMSFGSDGIYWVDGSSATSSNGLAVSSAYWEQPKSVAGAGYLIRIDKTGSSPLYNFSCTHCGTGGSVNPQNGLYLRNIEQVSLDHIFFSATSNTSINASAVAGLTIRNSFLQQGSTKTMTNMRRAKCIGRNTLTSIDTCAEELWIRTDNGNIKESMVLWDLNLYTETGTLADGASVALYMSGGSLKTSRIEVFARGATVRAGGTAILDNQGAALISTGLLFDDADTGSNLCVIWTSTTVANLKNNTGESLDYAYTQWFRR